MAVLRNCRPPRMHPRCTDPLLKMQLKNRLRWYYYLLLLSKIQFWIVPTEPIFEKCSQLREKGGVLTLKNTSGVCAYPYSISNKGIFKGSISNKGTRICLSLFGKTRFVLKCVRILHLHRQEMGHNGSRGRPESIALEFLSWRRTKVKLSPPKDAES
jgi:hypothetical protein